MMSIREYNKHMSYLVLRGGGLNGVWEQGTLPKITITDRMNYIIPSKPDYYGIPYGRYYIGQKPPPPLFSKAEWGASEPIFIKLF